MTYRFDYIHHYFTGMPADVVVNTFHLNWGGGGSPAAGDFLAAKDQLRTFYIEVFTSTSTSGMAPWIDQGLDEVKAYDLTDPVPRVPVYTVQFSGGATQSGSANTPLEVAICLSYQGAKVSGLNQANRRGRIFLGGLGVVQTSVGSAAFPVPTAGILANVASAAGNLLDNLAAESWVWGVYSPTLAGTVGPPGDFTPIVDGWVDNEFDTQRRRGNVSSARTLWP